MGDNSMSSKRTTATRLPLLLSLPLALAALAGCQSLEEIDRSAVEAVKPAFEGLEKAGVLRRRQPGADVRTSDSGGRCKRTHGAVRINGLDPDTAYVRLKRHFHFFTWEEAKNAYPWPEYLKETNFRHESLPGVRYSMSQDIWWDTPEFGRRNVWLNMDIERDGTATLVRWNHCTESGDWKSLGSPDEVESVLRKDIARALHE